MFHLSADNGNFDIMGIEPLTVAFESIANGIKPVLPAPYQNTKHQRNKTANVADHFFLARFGKGEDGDSGRVESGRWVSHAPNAERRGQGHDTGGQRDPLDDPQRFPVRA